MIERRRARVTVALLALAVGIMLCGGYLGRAMAGRPAVQASTFPGMALSGIHKIQHVVIIMQENRSFDNYFGTYPGADGIPMANGTPTTCVPDQQTGQCVYPYLDHADSNGESPHNTGAAIADINGGQMNGFINEWENGCKPPNKLVCTGTPDMVMGFHNGADIPNYWTYAGHFVLQDQMFEPITGYSLDAHLGMVSAWAATCKTWGDPLSCAATTSPQYLNDNVPIKGQHVPNYAWTDITYLLKHAGVSWKYYVADGTSADCTTPTPKHFCVPPPQQSVSGTIELWNPLPFFTDVKQDHQTGNIQKHSNLLADIASDTSCATSAMTSPCLPAVSWVVPSRPLSEEANANLTLASISDGQASVTSIINAIMRSRLWDSTAIFLAWDDWGGLYDHVKPPVIDSLGYGLRVPAMIISPYALAGTIDHQQVSFDAYLRFIEDDFLGGQRIDSSDGRPDPRGTSEPTPRETAVAGNLVNDFNFNQTPIPPLILTPYPNGTPTPTPSATPPGGASISVTPTSGRFHTHVILMGTGFSPSEQVKVYFDSTNSAPLASGNADGTGNVTIGFAVPATPLGTHSVIAVGQQRGVTASTPFQVKPLVDLSPGHGLAGSPLLVTGTGFGVNEPVTAYWASVGGPVLGTTTTNQAGTFTGSTAISATVPMSATGTYAVIAVGGTSGGISSAPFTLTGP